ncbi:MAG: ribonuclease HII [Clostridia bacterium]|nr:ribonuclease HII [Clostridia bacterium]
MKIETDLLHFEREQQALGNHLIAGVDEVGRGPLAGPVCCACCIMSLKDENIISGVWDSKKLSPKKRDELFDLIKEKAIAYSICYEDQNVIDKINILEATKKCMTNAINSLKTRPDVVLVDAVKNLATDIKQVAIIKGDALSYTIGCASILAKVSRDRLMDEYAKQYPEYGFEKHKGYGTKVHIEALKKYGACPLHRKSFIGHFVKTDE